MLKCFECHLELSTHKKLVIIKNGDHSLSDKKNLKRIINELKILIFNKF